MKTLKKVIDGKVEYVRVKDNEVSVKIGDGWTYCKKEEWKTATKGYKKGGKKGEIEKETDETKEKSNYSKYRAKKAKSTS